MTNNQSKLSVFYSICSTCNRRCSYCMNKIDKYSYKKQDTYYKLILDKIDSINKPIHLDITGGEPTTYNKFSNLITYISKMKNIERLILSTNGNSAFNWNAIVQDIHSIPNNLIVLTIHLENEDPLIIGNTLTSLSLYNLNVEVRIPYLSNYLGRISQLVKILSKYNLYKLLVLPIYSDKIRYTEEDYYNINKLNNKIGINEEEPYLPDTKNKYCVSAGINISPDGEWSKCLTSKKSQLPIYLYTNEDILENVVQKCPNNKCFFLSENHLIFDTFEEANEYKDKEVCHIQNKSSLIKVE